MKMLQSQEVFLATRLEAEFHGADNEEAHLTMSPSRNVAFLERAFPRRRVLGENEAALPECFYRMIIAMTDTKVIRPYPQG